MTFRGYGTPITWTIVGLTALALLLDYSMTFRLSREEVETHFTERGLTYLNTSYRVDSTDVQFIASGDSTRPLVLFIHGSPGSSSAFIDFLTDTALQRRGFLVSVDRPGFGYTTFGKAEPSLQRQAALIQPLMNRFGKNKKVILVGHSLGGPVAARMAMDFPEQVTDLLLVGASIDPALEPDEWYRTPLAYAPLRWIVPRSFRASNDEIRNLKGELESMLPLWATIRSHTVVLQGEEDILVPAENADFAKRMLTGTTVDVRLFKGVNHFIPWSQPELIRSALVEVLDKKQ